MSIFDLWTYWKRFWFRSESAISISIFRILYGIIMLEYCLLLYPDLLNWLGTHAVCSVETSQNVLAVLGPPGLNIFNWLPFSDTTVIIMFWLLTIASFFLTLGLFTRVSTIFVYVGLASFQQQNSLIINGGDILLKMTAFYLIFAPAGYYFSLDRLLKHRHAVTDKSLVQDRPSGWSLRLYRFLIALIYFQSFWSKLEDKTWLDGSAIYYVLREQEFLRFPVAWIANNLWLCQSLTWGTLIIEGAMWSLIWFKETRYYVIGGALLLHLGIEYTMNLPIFESLMIASLIVFVPGEDLKKAYNWLQRIIRLPHDNRRNQFL
ncbi:MAG: HTTM domain-containing protein [Candidatus Obscuribacterales bacterium]|nr:HTTM domain-containing protein [Candidatus Obscuribacterales bacterium]